MSQVEVLFDYWRDIDWFVIGGPADGDEAQAVRAQYPDVKCVGFEPNKDFCAFQEDNGFPGTIKRYALWNTNYRRLELSTPVGATSRSASVCRPCDAPDADGSKSDVSTPVVGRTLDSLSLDFGPFNRAALWLDVEHAELRALEGADQLLRSGAIKLINLETYAHLNLPAIVNLLCTQNGFKLRKVWNIGTDARRDAQDYIFTRGQ